MSVLLYPSVSYDADAHRPFPLIVVDLAWHRENGEQKSEQIVIRAAGASILRRLIFAAASPGQQPTGGGGRGASATTRTPSCRALLAGLDACDGRSEALRSLASLGLFGGGSGGGGGGNDGGVGRGGVSERRVWEAAFEVMPVFARTSLAKLS